MNSTSTRLRVGVWLLAFAAFSAFALRAIPARADPPPDCASGLLVTDAMVLVPSQTYAQPDAMSATVTSLNLNEGVYVIDHSTVSGVLWYDLALGDGTRIGWTPAADLQVISVSALGDLVDELPLSGFISSDMTIASVAPAQGSTTTCSAVTP